MVSSVQRALVCIVVGVSVATWADSSNITTIQFSAATYDATVSASGEQVARQFFQTHSDSYDFVVVFPVLPANFGTGETIGAHRVVRTSEAGIGHQAFDNGAVFGSHARLKGYIDISSIVPGSQLTVDDSLSILAHEVAHQWSGKVRFLDSNGQLSSELIGQQGAHWSFFLNSEASVLYGSQWDNVGPQTYRSLERKRYSALDLYLMGFIGPESVAPIQLLSPLGVSAHQATDIPPPDGTEISATVRTIPIDAIIAAEGVRVPNAALAQKLFRAAFVIVTAPGQQPTAAQLEHVEAVRSRWVNQFFFLTRGLAVMETDLVELAPPSAAQHPGVQAAVDYLLQHQQANGAWSDDARTQWRDTAAAVDALSGFRSDPRVASARALALAFEDSATPNDVDSASRRLKAIRNLDASRQFPAGAISSRTTADGLGLSWGYAPGVQDTALALLVQSYVQPTSISSRDWVWMKGTQSLEGGWPYSPNAPSRIEPTVHTLEALASLSDRGAAEQAIAMQALAFLRTKHFASGSFSDEGLESPAATSMSIQALASWNRLTSTEATGARDFLVAQQLADGSWSHRSFDTATTISALATILSPNLAATSLTVSRSVVVAGGDSTASVTVSNTSAVQTDATVVQAFGLDGVVLSQRLAVPRLNSGEQVTLKLPLETGAAAGTTQVFVIVDPDNTDPETKRDDNRASTAFAVQAPGVLPDLSVVEGSVSLVPASMTRVPQAFAATAAIGNAGLSDAGDVVVSVLANGVVIGSTHTSCGAQSIHQVTIPVLTTAVGQTALVVVVDLENAIAEAVESNNSSMASLPVVPTVAVALDSAVASSNSVTQGSNVGLTMTARNEGTVGASGGQLHVEVDPIVRTIFAVSEERVVRLVYAT